MTKKMKKKLIRIIISFILLVLAFILKIDNVIISDILFIISYLIVGYDIILKALRNITRGKVFDENFLMTIATIGAFFIGEFPEAVAVMLFYQVGELFQSYAVDKSRKSVSELMDIRPDYANLYQNKKTEKVDPNKVNGKMYIITLTRFGLVKKMEIEDFVSIPSSGLIYAKLDQGDFVQAVKFGTDFMNALIFSDRKAMNFPISMIPLMKRNAKGNKSFKSDLVDGMTMIPTKEVAGMESVSLLVITENGRFNKLPVLSVPNLDSVKKPFSVIKLTKDKVIDIHLVDENSIVNIKTLMDFHSIPVNVIPASSTISSGDRLLNTAKDKIVRTFIQQAIQ